MTKNFEIRNGKKHYLNVPVTDGAVDTDSILKELVTIRDEVGHQLLRIRGWVALDPCHESLGTSVKRIVEDYALLRVELDNAKATLESNYAEIKRIGDVSDAQFIENYSLRAEIASLKNKNDDCLKNVVCPQCKKPFRLIWNDYTHISGTKDQWHKQTLIIRGCPSGGIYDVAIRCPHCDYEEDL